MHLDQATIDELKKTKTGKRAVNQYLMLQSVQQIRDAMRTISEVFDSVDDIEINVHLLAESADYPFQYSFDEMECQVGKWFETLKEYYETH